MCKFYDKSKQQQYFVQNIWPLLHPFYTVMER